MKTALRAALAAAAVPLLAALAAAGTIRVARLSGGKLIVAGKSLKAGDVVPAGKPARLSGGARLVLDVSPWGKALIHGPAVFTPNAKGPDGVFMKAGGILSVLHKVLGRRYAVRTPAAVMSVRGTTFYAEARGPDSSYVCLCDGTLDIDSNGGYHSTMSTRKKHKPELLRFDGGTGLETEAPMEHHTDQEIAELSGAKAP